MRYSKHLIDDAWVTLLVIKRAKSAKILEGGGTAPPPEYGPVNTSGIIKANPSIVCYSKAH